MGLGASLMYVFDPDLGRRRRALVADQCTHARHSLQDFLGKATRDLGNRARGVVAESGHRLRKEPPPNDDVLVDRVRAVLGRCVSHPHAIQVAAMGGHVVLRGPILAGELDELLQATSEVPGVLDVADELEVHHGHDHPALQGGRPRPGPRPELLQESWSPATKLLIGAAGVALALPLVKRAPLTGLALGGLGLVLATRNLEGGRRGPNRSVGGGRARSVTPGAGGSSRDSGLPGAGRGRTDVTGRSGVYPGSGPYPPGDAPLLPPAEFVRGQFDEQGRPVEGGSEPIYMEGTLLGGATPPPSSPPVERTPPGNT